MNSEIRKKSGFRNALRRFANSFNFAMDKIMPDALVLAFILTLIVFLMGIFLAKQTPLQMIEYWGKGFWGFLAFGMQMVLALAAGYTVATAPQGQKILKKLASIPKTPASSVVFLLVVISFISWFNWAVGLVMSVFLARYIAMSQERVDFKMLAACAYIASSAIGMFGPSGPEFLIIATPGNFLEKTLGGLFPYSTTIFSPTVLTAEILAFFIILPLFMYLVHPDNEDTPKLPDNIRQRFEQEDKEALENLKNAKSKKDMTFAEKLDNNSIINYIIGIGGIIYIVNYFAKNGFNMTLDMMNFIILMIGIILHKTPNNLSNAFRQGVTNGYAVALQFPIYAGIQGMMGSSGLVLIIAQFFASMSTPETFIHWDYIAGAILNLFVPSSGGLFMVAGPALATAGGMLGVPGNPTIVAFTAGEAISNIIQPFWAIPILGIAGLKMKDIMGTCIFAFLIISIVVNIIYGVMW